MRTIFFFLSKWDREKQGEKQGVESMISKASLEAYLFCLGAARVGCVSSASGY